MEKDYELRSLGRQMKEPWLPGETNTTLLVNAVNRTNALTAAETKTVIRPA
jgi:hypothetical protein